MRLGFWKAARGLVARGGRAGVVGSREFAQVDFNVGIEVAGIHRHGLRGTTGDFLPLK